ncbi:MAG TPA: AraC family transcriptional regulator, partial [Ferruginibacter sp.]|nr:AraC family transcriptional regulator [Ferruginibacter sp.]
TKYTQTMIYYLKYDVQAICKRLIQEQLKYSGIDYSMLNANELDINQSLSNDFIDSLNCNLSKQGIQIVSSQKCILVQKIKEAIIDLVNLEDKLILSKTSHHLAKTLNHSYRYLSGIFSEITYTTIENYVILQKIEKAKEIIAGGEFTFTEIAWTLNYSSVGHFSMQFKNTTGFTPSFFKRLITQRRSNIILDSIK